MFSFGPSGRCGDDRSQLLILVLNVRIQGLVWGTRGWPFYVFESESFSESDEYSSSSRFSRTTAAVTCFFFLPLFGSSFWTAAAVFSLSFFPLLGQLALIWPALPYPKYRLSFRWRRFSLDSFRNVVASMSMASGSLGAARELSR